MKLKCVFSICFLILFVFLIQCFYVCFLPKLLNIQNKTPYIQQIFEDKTKLKLDIKNLQLKTYWNFSVSVSSDEIKIQDDTNNVIFKTEKPFIKIQPLKLLFKKLKLENLYGTNSTLNITRFANKEFGTNDFTFDGSEFPIDIEASSADINFDNFNIIFQDNYLGKKVTLNGTKFQIYPVSKKLSKLITDGKISIDDKTADFNFSAVNRFIISKKFDLKDSSASGEIKNIDLSAFDVYIDKFFNLKNAKGIINIDFNSSVVNDKKNESELSVSVQDLSVNEGDFAKQIIAKGDNLLKIKFNTGRNKINIDSLSLEGQNYSLYAKGSIKNYLKENPKVNLSVLLEPSKAETILDLLPPGVLKEIDIVKEKGISGDISGALNIKGVIPYPETDGVINAENVHVIRGKEQTHTGRIKLIFEQDKLKTNVFVGLPDGEQFFLDGVSELYGEHDCVFNIKTTNNFNLGLVKDILVPVSKIFNFQTGPVPMINVVSGSGNAIMKIKGTRDNANIDGIINIYNANGTFNGINAPLSNIDIKLDFQGEKLIFQTLSGDVSGYPAYVYGDCLINEGKLNLNIGTNSANANTLKNIVLTSPLLKETASAVSFIDSATGNVQLDIKMSAQIPKNIKSDFEDLFKYFKINGKIGLSQNNLKLKGFKKTVFIEQADFYFTDNDFKTNKASVICGKSPLTLSLNGNIPADKKKLPTTDINISGTNLYLDDTLDFVVNSDMAKTTGIKLSELPKFNSLHTLNFSGTMTGDVFDYKSVFADLKFLGNTKQKQLISSGEFIVKDGNINFNNISLSQDSSKINLNGYVNNFYTQRPIINMLVSGDNLSVKNTCDILSPFSEDIKKTINSIKNIEGKMNVNLKITETGYLGNVIIKNLAFRNIATGIPLKFKDININIDKKEINFGHITGEAGGHSNFPFSANVIIYNYMKIPCIKGNLSLKPNSGFFDRYINSKLEQPIKIIGDINFSTSFNGSADSLMLEPKLTLHKDSDIFLYAVNLGDTDINREVSGVFYVKPKEILLKNIQYKKANTPILTINGNLKKIKNNFNLENLSLYTNQILPAKWLNFIFKKSFIKNGNFKGNLNIKNCAFSPKMTGNITLDDVEIPLYSVKIDKADIIADENKIIINSNGNLIDTAYSLSTEIYNNLVQPIKIKSVNIKTTYMNLEKLLERFNQWSIDAYTDMSLKNKVSINISDIIIENGLITVDAVDFKTAPITGLEAEFNLDKNSLLNVKSNKFKMAEGDVLIDASYNFRNGYASLYLNADSVNSDAMAYSVFGLKNQIDGKLNGNIKISAQGMYNSEKLKNLEGIVSFNVKEGHMIKLGSLEYLLRASNLISSGLTALSVHNLIELLKPFKTGSFANIDGSFELNKGNIENLKIFSKGENLSIYIKGRYITADNDANITVYGKLGKKIAGILGPIGNLSANTIIGLIPHTDSNSDFEEDLSKIPDIEYKNDDVKLFMAKVKGDINNDNEAINFKWIK